MRLEPVLKLDVRDVVADEVELGGLAVERAVANKQNPNFTVRFCDPFFERQLDGLSRAGIFRLVADEHQLGGVAVERLGQVPRPFGEQSGVFLLAAGTRDDHHAALIYLVKNRGLRGRLGQGQKQ